MKTIELNPASPDVVQLLDNARDEDVIVRLSDGREFLLVAVDDFDRELAAQRANDKLMAFVDSRAKSTDVINLEEVKRRLNI